MNRTQANYYIKSNLSLSDYLQPAPNHHNNTGYICPACGSGRKSGSNSTGAVEYYPATNSWYCHSCKAGGDIFNFYRYQTGSTYTEALDALAKAACITIDGKSEQKPAAADVKAIKKEQASEIISDQSEQAECLDDHDSVDFTEYYIKCCDNLTKYPEALDYLSGRGISLQTARRFIIGYDPEADPAKKGHKSPRIIAPCESSFYVARAIDPSTPARYINPGKVTLFNISTLYTNRAKYCFICEGLFDALAVEETGRPAIALNGAGNGKLLIEQLQSRPAQGKTFIICFDRDANESTRAKVEKQAAELADALTKANYKAITANICGRCGDPDEALTMTPHDFEEALTQAEQLAERDELTDFFDKVQTTAYKPIESGLQFFDDLTGGTMSQTLTVLLGEPGSGKSMLMQQLAENMATHNTDRKVIYINFEMSKEQLLARAISARVHSRGKISRTQRQILQGYKWTEAERREIAAAIDDYRRESLDHIAYNPAEVTPELDNIIEYLNTLTAQADGKPAPALFVDYLQLIQSDKLQDIKDRLTAALIALKEYAIKNNTFVYLISAINRNSNGHITIASARDTSAIEYQADVILSIDNYKDQENNGGLRRMILNVLKGRDGSGSGCYRIINRDGANNTFYDGKQGGKVSRADAKSVPDWLEDPDEVITNFDV